MRHRYWLTVLLLMVLSLTIARAQAMEGLYELHDGEILVLHEDVYELYEPMRQVPSNERSLGYIISAGEVCQNGENRILTDSATGETRILSTGEGTEVQLNGMEITAIPRTELHCVPALSAGQSWSVEGLGRIRVLGEWNVQVTGGDGREMEGRYEWGRLTLEDQVYFLQFTLWSAEGQEEALISTEMGNELFFRDDYLHVYRMENGTGMQRMLACADDEGGV